jgi:anti-sigma factor RsiW
MTIDEADILAWLDGELAPAEAARVASAVAADPALTRLAEAHRGVAERLRKGFAPLLAEPMGASNVVEFARREAPQPAPQPAPRRFVMPAWTALAATLVIGLITGSMVGRGALVTSPGDRPDIIAHSGLANALDTQLASGPQDGAIRIALTFRARDGKLCRTWAAAAQAGIACRAGDDWAIKALAPTAASESGGYRTAAGAGPQLMATVDAMIDGAPLDAAQEASARAASWR